MTMADVALKPCPFCGYKAYHYQDSNGIKVEDMTIAPGVMHYVMCSGCSALVSGASRAEAEREWNRRVGDGDEETV